MFAAFILVVIYYALLVGNVTLVAAMPYDKIGVYFNLKKIHAKLLP